jgi:acyl dehydratase
MGREIHARETRFGRYYEEFELGDVYHHWPGKTETETQFGRNVVVGNLVYSLVLGMSVPDVSGKAIANLEVESLRHARPTFHGDTIYARSTVLDKRESQSKPDRGIVTVETVGWNQREETVCEFRRRVLVPKRPLAAR